MEAFSVPEFILGQVSGFILGLAASFLSWWILVHLVVPCIRFDDIISKSLYDSSAQSFSYRAKIKNIGRRDLVDGYVTATLVIKGLRFPKTWTTFRIPLLLSGETTAPIPVLKRGKNKIFRLCFELCPDLKLSPYVPQDIREEAKKGRLTLERLLAFEKSYLTLFVVGADAISGARKVFESPQYKLSDIFEGPFKSTGHKLLAVEARSTAPAGASAGQMSQAETERG